MGLAFCNRYANRLASSDFFKQLKQLGNSWTAQAFLFTHSLGKLLSAFLVLHVIFEHACDSFLELIFLQ